MPTIPISENLPACTALQPFTGGAHGLHSVSLLFPDACFHHITTPGWPYCLYQAAWTTYIAGSYSPHTTVLPCKLGPWPFLWISGNGCRTTTMARRYKPVAWVLAASTAITYQAWPHHGMPTLCIQQCLLHSTIPAFLLSLGSLYYSYLFMYVVCNGPFTCRFDTLFAHRVLPRPLRGTGTRRIFGRHGTACHHWPRGIRARQPFIIRCLFAVILLPWAFNAC